MLGYSFDGWKKLSGESADATKAPAKHVDPNVREAEKELERALGVRVRIKALAWGPFLEAVKASTDVPMYLLGWEADFPDPSNFLDVLLHSKNIGSNNNTNYSNPAVDALLLDMDGVLLDTRPSFTAAVPLAAAIVVRCSSAFCCIA